MEKRQDKYYLYLRWPRYLAQWYAHEVHRLQHFESKTQPPFRYECDVDPSELEPVITRRGSVENGILELCLTKQPDPVPKPIPKDATICLQIPEFLGKPSRYYNYLSPASEALLEATVRNHFRVSLQKFLNKTFCNTRAMEAGYAPSRNKFIEVFMENNGIDYEHLHTISDQWRRMYKLEWDKACRLNKKIKNKK